MKDKLLEVNNLVTRFFTEQGVVRAVDGNSFHLFPGETLGIVGESGSGKTVTALSIMRLIENPGEIMEGTVTFQGESLLKKTEEEMRETRGNEIGMVFQDSLSSLNPTMSIGEQIRRVMRFHDMGLTKSERRERAISLLDKVGIPNAKKRVENYPHEFSGGMRQRALIAMAISCNPTLLILDEPTTALDVTIEAQIFELVNDLQEDYGMGTILITHDLAVVANSCSRVIMMYAGRIVEKSSTFNLYERPLHPYTEGLLASIPHLEGSDKEQLPSIPGEVPDLINLPVGCNFTLRCSYSDEKCPEIDPDIEEFEEDHFVACRRVEDIR